MKYLSHLIIFFIVAGCATLPEHYASVHSREVLKLAEVLSGVRGRSVVFVGESHSSGRDHLVELEVIRYFHEKGLKLAVGLEMFPAEMQLSLDRWEKGSMDDDSFERLYSKTWNMPYYYYGKIFDYAKRERIPLVGLNAPEFLVGEIARNGLTSVDGDTLKALGYTSCTEEPRYRKLIGFFAGRAAHVSGLPSFCDAQRFRDTVMAYHIAAAMQQKNFDVMVVLAGSAHVLKPAVPAILARYSGLQGPVLISAEFRNLVSSLPERETADYVWY